MPPKMSNQMDVLEERLTTMENFGEFRETMMTEFTKLIQSSKGHSSNSGHQNKKYDDGISYGTKEGGAAIVWWWQSCRMDHISRDILWSTRDIRWCEGLFDKVEHWGCYHSLVQHSSRNREWLNVGEVQKALIERYGGRQSDNSFEELKDLKQTETVDEYISKFENISSQVR